MLPVNLSPGERVERVERVERAERAERGAPAFCRLKPCELAPRTYPLLSRNYSTVANAMELQRCEERSAAEPQPKRHQF